MATIHCDDCDKPFKTESGFEWHIQRTHQANSGEPRGTEQPSTDDWSEEISLLGFRVERLEESMNALNNISERFDELAEVRDQVGGIREQLKAFEESFNRHLREDGAKATAWRKELSDVEALARKGAIAQQGVLTLAKFIKEDMLPALVQHAQGVIIKVYEDQQTIDQLPKCSYCGGSREEGQRTCGNFQCVAKVLRVSASRTQAPR